ncbi:hypothetical protein [Bacillus atrophaeus]|uniref:hypothetical protein n=1 Tax=Bacillus atrophaeus TaxID=1452 RepID=UPI002280D69C|nr:hypothetical protein [Bacillus atrophaeus]MCY8478072.1 hypothetical protein [Bacillus atrophaeus]
MTTIKPVDIREDIQDILRERLRLLEKSTLHLSAEELKQIVDYNYVEQYMKEFVPEFTDEIRYLYKEYVNGALLFKLETREQLKDLLRDGYHVCLWETVANLGVYKNVLDLMKQNGIDVRIHSDEKLYDSIPWTHEYANYLNDRFDEFQKYGELINVTDIEKGYLKGMLGKKVLYEFEKDVSIWEIRKVR